MPVSKFTLSAGVLFSYMALVAMADAQVVSGYVTTAAPTYSNNTPSPLSLTTGGALRVDSSGAPAGTVTANQGTPNAGGAANSWPVQGAGVAGTPAGGVVSVQGVSGGTNQNVNVNAPLPAGTNVIGHTINDTGSTTAVTGNVTVVQPTGTNLHAVLDTTSTTAVTQPTGSNLHAQLDSGSTTAVTQATGTNLHAVIDTGSTTAATQATGTNLHTVTDSTSVTSLIPGTTGGLLSFVLEPVASDNHTVIKNGAGQVYGVHVWNNSAVVNYGRLYNAGTGFNGCNSATGLLYEFHIPSNSTSDAGFVVPIPQGLAFGTGISICVTSGYGQTNTTAATASAISLDVLYF